MLKLWKEVQENVDASGALLLLHLQIKGTSGSKVMCDKLYRLNQIEKDKAQGIIDGLHRKGYIARRGDVYSLTNKGEDARLLYFMFLLGQLKGK